MALIPAALLSRWYVKGSLAKSDDECEFRLKNTTAPSIIISCDKVEVDGQSHPLEKVFIIKKISARPATSLTPKNPLSLDINEEVRIVLKDLPLSPGFHKILIQLRTKEVGPLKIPVEDTLWAE